MANCKKPLESALKTFVFFLVSQPLIYLFQIPFSWMGWRLFGYYRTWFIWTLLTFPMAFVGWFLIKKNWLSVLILVPVLESLPDSPSFSGEAEVIVEDDTMANVQLHNPEEGIVYVSAWKYGETEFTLKDGDKEYHYTMEVYDEDGSDRINIQKK